MISRLTTLLDSNVQCSTTKNHKAYKEVGQCGPVEGKKNPTGSVLKKSLMAKVFKTTVLKILTELKKDVGKVKKIICEQNGNTDKEKT